MTWCAVTRLTGLGRADAHTLVVTTRTGLPLRPRQATCDALRRLSAELEEQPAAQDAAADGGGQDDGGPAG